MGKTVLVINSSSRIHGNCEVLCQRFTDGAQTAGHQVEQVHLRSQKIAPCLACDYCRSHDGECARRDDMAAILEKSIQADVIVMATPVYFNSMNAQMKAFIDRCVAKFSQIANKDFYFIITAGKTDMDDMNKVIDGFRGYTNNLPNAVLKGVVYGIGVWNKGEVSTTLAANQAYEFGKAL